MQTDELELMAKSYRLLQQQLAAEDTEIKRLRKELADCQRLLREACDKWTNFLPEEWIEQAALAAGGGHDYEPFTTRDGSQACRHCDGTPRKHNEAARAAGGGE